MINRIERGILKRFRLKLGRDRSLVDVVRCGMPTKNALDFLHTTSGSVPYETMIRVAGISKRTLERRSGKKLKPDQSDRLVRIARIIGLAEDSIGTEEQALEWLNTPNQALYGSRPIESLDTDAGASRVETVLGRLREGSVA